MIPTDSIEDILYRQDEEPIEECKHNRVVLYGNDHATCCNCGARIEIEELNNKYRRVQW